MRGRARGPERVAARSSRSRPRGSAKTSSPAAARSSAANGSCSRFSTNRTTSAAPLSPFSARSFQSNQVASSSSSAFRSDWNIRLAAPEAGTNFESRPAFSASSKRERRSRWRSSAIRSTPSPRVQGLARRAAAGGCVRRATCRAASAGSIPRRAIAARSAAVKRSATVTLPVVRPPRPPLPGAGAGTARTRCSSSPSRSRGSGPLRCSPSGRRPPRGTRPSVPAAPRSPA